MKIIVLFIILLSSIYSLNKQHVPIEQDRLQESMAKGAVIYTDFCMQCHLDNGKGVPGTFPPLAPSNWFSEKRKESIQAVKFGLKGPISVNGKDYNGLMPPAGLSDEEIADVLNYIMNSWGNTQDTMVTPKEVEAVKK